MRVFSRPTEGGWHTAIVSVALAMLLVVFAGVVMWLAGDDLPGAGASTVPDATFATPDAMASLQVPGKGAVHVSKSLHFDLSPRAMDASRRVVWIARDPVEQVWIEAPGWPETRLHFYRPDSSEGVLPSAFVFPVPDAASGPVSVRLHASGAIPVSLQVQVLGEDTAAHWQQRTIALNLIVYSGCFLLALVAVALFWAVRESFFLLLFAACAITGVLFAASNGHLYGFPLLGAFGVLKAQGLWGLVLLFVASLLALTLQLVNGRARPLQARVLRAVIVLQVLAGAVLMLGLDALVPFAQSLASVGCVLAILGVFWLLATAVRQRASMALPVILLFLAVLVAAGVRIAVAQGLLAGTLWVRYGYQLATVALLAVLAMALIGRIGVYRQQRDDERDARELSDRRMQREAGRSALARILQARLRELAPVDIEWTAFRLLFEHLLPHAPADSAAVVVRGYHGRDVLVTEPIDDEALPAGLVGTRLLMLRRQAQAGRPLQHVVETETGRRMEAVVPIPVSTPGWGALLLQRDGIGGFDEAELALAAEFARLTVLHADEAVATHALRRTAERDALTGSHNRRGIDQWLGRHFAGKPSPPLSVLFVDIDHFKRINDLYGHACGDHCLRSVAATIGNALATQDMVGRYGGEEFIALLPGTDLTRARAMAERVRAAVEASEIEWQGRRHPLTVSVGVATRDPSDSSPAVLVERADAAMYEAKRSGRNQVAASKASFDG